MPVFQVDEEDAKALAVLLKSFQSAQYPLNYIYKHAAEPAQVRETEPHRCWQTLIEKI